MKYIGKGSFLPGIPARDLSVEEVTKHGKRFLLETGLYAIAEVKPKQKIKVDKPEVDEKWQA